MASGRDGKSYQRDVVLDVRAMQGMGITLVICLIADIEIRSIGCNIKQYEASCQKSGIELFKYPIVEMAPPKDLNIWNEQVVLKAVKHILEGKGNVLIHCRGGIGRAGTLACNILSSLFEFKSSKHLIKYVREHRDKRCVESTK